MESMFFDSWEDLLQIAVTVPIVYLFIILSVRVLGKRSTSRMNNFDWIVTVAIGAITGTSILDDNTAILEALLAIALLFGLQYLLTWATLKNEGVQKIVKSRPRLLVHNGQYLDDAMEHERITRGEVMAAIRGKGLLSVQDAKWVILEPDATFSIVQWDERDFSQADFGRVKGFGEKWGGGAQV
jgi:uncharacterized membrane protein YcaP (DUF421 family)